MQKTLLKTPEKFSKVSLAGYFCPEKDCQIFSPAKINFHLQIHSRRPDGYRQITADFFPVSLFDQITISPTTEKYKVRFFCDFPEIVSGKNTVLHAIQELEKLCEVQFSFDLILQKNIPIQAGFGGGSSNAACLLKFLVEYFDLKVTESELCSLALKIGADVPFFLNYSPGIYTGLGEEKICDSNIEKLPVILMKPEFSISTTDAYASFPAFSDYKEIPRKISLEYLQGAPPEINAFWQKKLPYFEKLSKIREKIQKIGIKNALLTGSGSGLTLIGIENFTPSALSRHFPSARFFSAYVLGSSEELNRNFP